MKKIPIKERIQKSIKKLKSGCWIWRLGKYKDGYGYIRIGSLTDGTRRKIASHIASYLEYNGKIPKGFYVLHKCDVRACCNPRHLWVGTQKDNIQDASKKGKMKSWRKGLRIKCHRNKKGQFVDKVIYMDHSGQIVTSGKIQ
jgi:hypothetical protein